MFECALFFCGDPEARNGVGWPLRVADVMGLRRFVCVFEGETLKTKLVME